MGIIGWPTLQLKALPNSGNILDDPVHTKRVCACSFFCTCSRICSGRRIAHQLFCPAMFAAQVAGEEALARNRHHSIEVSTRISPPVIGPFNVQSGVGVGRRRIRCAILQAGFLQFLREAFYLSIDLGCIVTRVTYSVD